MKTEIIRASSDGLSRQVWVFALNATWSSKACIYFDIYRVESKETSRHKWHIGGSWDRTFARNSSIIIPPLPHDVLEEARQYFKAQIDTLEVKQ